MNKSSLVHREQGFMFALQMTFTAALIAGAFGHVWLWSHPDNRDEELAVLGAAIEDNLVHEVVNALGQLDGIEQQPAVNQIADYARRTIAPSERDGCTNSHEPDRDVTQKIESLREKQFKLWASAFPAKPPPDYDLVFWTDKNGYQIVRNAPKARGTPPDVTRLCGWDSFIKVSQEEDQLWSFSPRVKAAQNIQTRFYIEGGNSPSVGRYVVHISRKSQLSNKEIVSATIAVPLASLADPILVPGFAFAIVDQDGQVIFHSDLKKNRKETFSTPVTAINNWSILSNYARLVRPPFRMQA